MTPAPSTSVFGPLVTEVATYYRELPRLLAEGEAGRIVLIKGDRVVGVWDTFDDAYQAGVLLFGFGPFLAQPIDTRDPERPAPYFPTPAGGASG